jgi:hypothetical protein
VKVREPISQVQEFRSEEILLPSRVNRRMALSLPLEDSFGHSRRNFNFTEKLPHGCSLWYRNILKHREDIVKFNPLSSAHLKELESMVSPDRFSTGV